MVLPGCQNNSAARKVVAQDTTSPATSTGDPSLAGEFSGDAVYRFDSAEIGLFLKRFPLFRAVEADLRQFYRMRNYSYAWYAKEGLIDQSEDLYNHIINISSHGIPDRTPYKDQLTTKFDVYSEEMKELSPERELMLTAQYFTYATAVWGGIGDKEWRSMRWYIPKKKMDLPSLMDSLLRDSSGSFIQKGYATNQYFLLRKFLRSYQRLDSAGPWGSIRPDRNTYHLHDSSNSLQSVRHRLVVLGDLPSDDGSPVFDNELENGIKHFQTRWGMKAEGTLGPQTLRKLNTSPKTYIKAIMVNMERARWIPVELQDHYLIVNIPAFELYAVDRDSLPLRMKVVVGKSMHQTVVFNGNVQYVVFSPYWNVPPGIMKAEILPALKKDPGYLKRNDMEWNGNAVRQKPGPQNALGEVKFLFLNTHNIYLHDSPAKHLFNEETRAFSHGCIRVAEPRKLALYLLKNQPEWTTDKVAAAMNNRKEKFVTLKNPLPVYIAYMTAWVDQAGNLDLRDDIYRRDDLLASAILARN
jgi:murein L,D-transpeptidase YcbB/YkuD